MIRSMYILPILIFMLISLLSLFSLGKEYYFIKQSFFWIIGFFIFLSSNFIKYSNLAKPPYFSIFLIISLLLLAANLFFPNKSWINFGFINFQTSEFARLAFLLTLANFFSKYSRDMKLDIYLIFSFLITLPFLILILAQPDFGMAILYFSTWLIVVLNFITFRQIVKILLVFIFIFIIAWFLILKDYQKERILTFIFPNRDPLGSGYNLNQVRIAIGSGGFFGKGFGKGSQGKLGFLPSSATDFLLSSFLEEWGFFGFLIYIVAVIIFLFSIFRETQFLVDPVFQSFGIVMMLHFGIRFLFTTAINLGIAPIIGIPIPFLSYGGSHLISDFLILSTWRSASK